MAYFSKTERDKWYNSLPALPVGAKLLLSNPQGEYLLVKPNYRPGWQFVGGVVEKDESPLQAALREMQEEIGLVLETSRLTFKGVGYESPEEGHTAVLCVMFAAMLTDEEAAQIRLQATELSAFKFVQPDALPAADANPSLHEALALLRHHLEVGYVEDGELTVNT